MADEQGVIPEARVVLTRIVVAHNRLRRSEITTQEFDEYALGLLAAQSGTEPFGYWVEQKHADPVLLRKPAYIPEPSKLREVTPLYTHPAATGSVREAVAWCSPGQLANLMDVDDDGGVYLPIRKTERGNFTMPLFAAAPAPDAAGSGPSAIAPSCERCRKPSPQGLRCHDCLRGEVEQLRFEAERAEAQSDPQSAVYLLLRLANEEDAAIVHHDNPVDRGRCAVIAAEFRRVAKILASSHDAALAAISTAAPDAAASREPDPVWLNDPASLDGGAPDAAAIRPDSWTATPEDVREQVLLLAEVELHLQSCRVFLTTREKMHSCGVDLHGELLAKVTAAIETIGREKANG